MINYLSAKYGEFTFNEVKDEIEDLFSESYTITTWVEEVEITPSDDEDEDEEEPDEDEDEEDDEPETIILHILHFKVDRKPLEEIVADRMNDEEMLQRPKNSVSVRSCISRSTTIRQSETTTIQWYSISLRASASRCTALTTPRT